MPDRLPLVYVALLLAAVVAHAWWRFRTARGIAEEWLSSHRYRIRAIRSGWLSINRFAPRFLRNDERSYEFRVEVDDLRLGGTGVLWLRVWTDWIGMIEREPEVSWERMPVIRSDEDRTAEDRWAETQRALLERVVRGESTFRVPVRVDHDTAPLDEVVEHLMALQRRGLVTCDAPLLSRHGGVQYDAVSNVAITESGKRWLAERSASVTRETAR